MINKDIDKYREKLLDIGKRNRLISLKHRENSLQHIRIIDEIPDILYSKLMEEKKTLSFKALPEKNETPPDETPDFCVTYNKNLSNSEDYQNVRREYNQASKEGVEELQEYVDKIERLEYEINNVTRTELNLPIWKPYDKLSKEDIARKYAINPSYDLHHQEGSLALKHEDDHIQTLLTVKEMDRKLRGLRSYVNSDSSETGVNTLFLVFGFLEWYESETSTEPCLSPLMLLPLDIKKTKKNIYQISHNEEDIEYNLSLALRMQKDFQIDLPKIEEDEQPHSYIKKIAKFIQDTSTNLPHKSKWRIRNYITIGRFYFARLAMYNDLNPQNWPQKEHFLTNPNIQELLSGGIEKSDNIYNLADDYDIDTEEVERLVPLLIMPADASQHSALVDVMEGKNLALEGPPGTGKSQTIANMIANALHEGKKILFLAEKMAALNVVFDRLKSKDLDIFCLELHSTKLHKKEVYDSIKKRLNAEKTSLKYHTSPLKEKEDMFRQSRSKISKYLSIMNMSFGQAEKTIQENLWAARLYEDEVTHIHPNLKSKLNGLLSHYDCFDPTPDEIFDIESNLQKIVQLYQAVKAQEIKGKHPWGFIVTNHLARFQREELQENIREFCEDINHLLSLKNEYYKDHNLSYNFLQYCTQYVEKMQNIIEQCSCMDILDKIKNLQQAKQLAGYIDSNVTYNENIQKISSVDISQEIHFWEAKKQLNIASDYGLEPYSDLADISNIIAGNKNTIKLWQDCLEKLTNINNIFGISEKIELGNFKKILKMMDYISEIPRSYLLNRREEILKEENSEYLEKSLQHQKEIKNKLQHLEEVYDFSSFPSVNELKIYATALDYGHFFSFIIDSTYKKAKKLHQIVHRQKSPYNKESWVAALKEVAELKEQQEKIQKDERLALICGDLFMKDQTDLEQIVQINRWACGLRRKFTTADSLSIRIRDFLLTGDMHLLDIFLSLNDDGKIKSIKNELDNMKEESLSMDVWGYLQQIEQQTEILDHIYIPLKAITKNNETSLYQIQTDLEYFDEAIIAKEQRDKLKPADLLISNETLEETKIIGNFINQALALEGLSSLWDAFFQDENKFSDCWHLFAQNNSKLKSYIMRIEPHIAKIENLEIQFNSFYHFNEESWKDISLENWQDVLNLSYKYPQYLSSWGDYQQAVYENKNQVTSSLVQLFLDENFDISAIIRAFRYVIHQSNAKEIYKRYRLSDEKGASLEENKRKIKKLDEEIAKLKHERLVNKLLEHRPYPGVKGRSRKDWTEGCFISNEIQKQKSYHSIRKLMQNAGRSVQKIKPCFLMSPMSVAQYLNPHDIRFDLVIIDEASQMFPEEALGAIARAKQVVVVGDPKQLPPSSFFASQNRNEDNDHDEKDESEDIFIEDSIMDMAITCFQPARSLTRHYRSRDESLIRFCNYYFYDNQLYLYPSSQKGSSSLGLMLEYIEDSDYHKGQNPKEARYVVKKALEFMKKHPDRSLGIAAMNKKQQELIEKEMDEAFFEDEMAQKYQEKWQNTLEPFFIKNLENVQGDERDAIFISIVYGPDEKGIVHQRFGPINSKGGHRRLNVLFSRAKKNMVVFSSLKSNDIRASENSSQGLRAFRDFLLFAETGKLDDGKQTHREADSAFEVFVKNRLEAIGLEVHPQIGVSKYRIDLGVKHPQYPHGYLLGVECDGAPYHSSKSARERDILRQQVLEGLGWNIYRIWSTDWFENPQNEIEKLKKHIEELLINQKGKIIPSSIESIHQTEKQESKMALSYRGVQQEYQDVLKLSCAVELFDYVTYSLKNEFGATPPKRVQVVENENNGEREKINKNTPIGQALLGGQKGDEIAVSLPHGNVILLIHHIEKYKIN